MTESKWLTCAEPSRMLAHLTETGAGSRLASERKLRLYVEACREFASPERAKADWGFDLDMVADLHEAVSAWGRDSLSGEDLKISLVIRADLLRDLFGNPFRPRGVLQLPFESIGHPWLTWQNGTIPRMAQQIYDARDFAALPVLADALEDAGCTEEAILRHCRGQGREHRCKHCEGNGWLFRDILYGDTMTDPCEYCDGTGFQVALHVRGCWCLDLLLGKE